MRVDGEDDPECDAEDILHSRDRRNIHIKTKVSPERLSYQGDEYINIIIKNFNQKLTI